MSNWCSNFLYINADSNQSIRDFLLDFGKNGSYEMNNILPVPFELSSPYTSSNGWSEEDLVRGDIFKPHLKYEFGYDSWCDFCHTMWGTKWDIRDTDDSFNDGKGLSFSSAWDPPTEFFYNISSLYPKIEFILYYFKSNLAFVGVYSIKNRIVSQNTTHFLGDKDEKKILNDFIYAHSEVWGNFNSWFLLTVKLNKKMEMDTSQWAKEQLIKWGWKINVGTRLDHLIHNKLYVEALNVLRTELYRFLVSRKIENKCLCYETRDIIRTLAIDISSIKEDNYSDCWDSVEELVNVRIFEFYKFCYEHAILVSNEDTNSSSIDETLHLADFDDIDCTSEEMVWQ